MEKEKRGKSIEISMAINALEKACLIMGDNIDFFDLRDIIDNMSDDDISTVLLSYSRAAIYNDIIADYIFQARKILEDIK